MASAISTEKLFSKMKVEMFDHDPGATSATLCTGAGTNGYVDLKDYGNFAVLAMSSTLTGAGITKLEIVAADDTSGTNLTVVKDSGTVAADAVGDYVVEECTAEEIAQLSAAGGYSLRYVGARLTVADAADEAFVTYIRAMPRFPQTGLTADTIA